MLTLRETHEIPTSFPPYKQNYSKRFLEFSREKRAQKHTSQQANKEDVNVGKAGQTEGRRTIATCWTKPHSHWYLISDNFMLFICALFSYLQKKNHGITVVTTALNYGNRESLNSLAMNFSNVYSQNAYILLSIHFNPRKTCLMIHSI